ncbi:hypothetical protein EMIHUDRAFT_434457, partial [Emiliania huxleyi CCMP1516]|uniref:Large ribosomal subunit protein uL18c n=2 Tax=Emiliania huxleyi TaxID=2903 RepID=A0A0D3K2I8_EMIH1|mmetsp:Transcript_6768/g.21623  ORF Transcript_6768/g.21623 Transcript_6768/m.21623 type:complete len:143 (+) Transcript_6768:35-463(+)
MTLLALCALLLTGAEAFSAPVAPRGLSRTASPAMKHNEYYGRLAKAEAGRMRLVCVRTNNHIYAQVVDDSRGHIMASASTIEKGNKLSYGGNVAAAVDVGKRVAERAKEKGVSKVYFDRHGKKYHGRVAALADAAREAGLDF